MSGAAFNQTKFRADAAELWARIDAIDALRANKAFRDAIEALLANLLGDALFTGTLGAFDKGKEADRVKMAVVDSIVDILKQIRGFEVPYRWYVDHQHDADFASKLPSEAVNRSGHGRFWSKLNTRRSEKAASEAGVFLESSVAGVLFNGLDFGRRGWGWSPSSGYLWDKLSQTYADHLHGVAEADVLDGRDPKSVLSTTEWDRISASLSSGKLTEFRVNIYRFEGNMFTIEKTVVITKGNLGAWTSEIPDVPATAEWRARQGAIDTHERFLVKFDEILTQFPDDVREGRSSPKVSDLLKILDPKRS